MSHIKRLFLILVITSGLSINVYSNDDNFVRIGYLNFDEQYLLALISRQQLIDIGAQVKLVPFDSYFDLRNAMFSRDIDIYWGYTGQTAINDIYATPPYVQEELYDQVKEFDQVSSFIWLQPSTLVNNFTLAVRKTSNSTNELETIEDLAKLANQQASGVNITLHPIFLQNRIDAMEYLANFYGSNIDKFIIATEPTFDAIYSDLRDSKINIGLAHTTDFQLDFYSLRQLADNKNAFPPFQLAPVIQANTLTNNAEFEQALNDISIRLNTHLMRYLLQRWKVDKIGARSTAKEFLYADEIYPNSGRRSLFEARQ
ncbi:Osmoprotectant-binding protein OsmX [Sinobacterium norvegicum]|uniref:Osmoprotectant-binding protein OsmX n=1 Tax=Sinobacterium norvegicum TaxID=1641715 RepID=A0ABN8ELZ5_9GAMM|nr:glycine betaine ABC transporter substrate-binding protein [Sinobacterium norvegicum]CAH0993403.1 Osmoprotectant-binding protein OsmX [Sinobacterium norvegicum]